MRGSGGAMTDAHVEVRGGVVATCSKWQEVIKSNFRVRTLPIEWSQSNSHCSIKCIFDLVCMRKGCCSRNCL